MCVLCAAREILWTRYAMQSLNENDKRIEILIIFVQGKPGSENKYRKGSVKTNICQNTDFTKS